MGFDGTESALIIPVPESEHTVQNLRYTHDSSAQKGVPAHITLIYPFIAPQDISESVLSDLKSTFLEFPHLNFALTYVKAFPETVYLHPEPSQPFKKMTEKLVEQYPNTPPYGGIYDDIIPHLTLADFIPSENLDNLKNSIEEKLRPHLPITCKTKEVWLLIKKGDRWKKQAVFPLAA